MMKFRKVISMLMAATMIFTLGACGGGTKPSESTATTDTQKSGKYKVAFILNCSINDGGWGTACYSELVSACEKNSDWTMEYTDNLSQDGYYDAMVAYCNAGFNLIYAPGGEYTDAVLQVANEYPNIAFAILNGDTDVPEKATNKNVTSLLPNAQQIGWIAGALAGLMSETGNIAFIGGMELTTTVAKYKGYAEAAKYVAEKDGKSINVLDAVYANSFDDSSKGIEFANAMMEQNADVFFGDASAVDSGARQAIDEHNSAKGKVEVYDIGQPADILGQNECVIGSQITDNSSLIELSFKAIEEGKFGGEVLYGDLQNGVLSVGKLSDLVPAEKQSLYNEYIEQMKADKFMK